MFAYARTDKPVAERHTQLLAMTSNPVWRLAHFREFSNYHAQFDVQVSCSMLELYNDKLIDLLRLSDQAEVK